MLVSDITTLLTKAIPSVDPFVLGIHAELILKYAPQVPAVLERILAAPEDNHGRKAAIKHIQGRILHDLKLIARSKITPAQKAQFEAAVRDEGRVLWEWRARQDDSPAAVLLARYWAYTNAAYETAPCSYNLFREDKTLDDLIYTDEYADPTLRLHYRHFTGTVENLDEISLTDEYWRGLAALNRFGYWPDDEAEALQFVLWAGAQPDITTVISHASTLSTLDYKRVEAIMHLTPTQNIPRSQEETTAVIQRTNSAVALAESIAGPSRSGIHAAAKRFLKMERELVDLIADAFREGRIDKTISDVLSEKTTPEDIREVLYYSHRLGTTASTYYETYYRVLRKCHQLGVVKDYSAGDENFLAQCMALITVTRGLEKVEAEIWTASKDGDLPFNRAWTNDGRMVTWFTDDDLIHLVLDNAQDAHRIADIISSRRILDHRQIAKLLEVMDSTAPAVLSGSL